MLIEKDKMIIAKDSSLPGLSLLLDNELLLTNLQLIPKLKNVLSVEVGYLRYKPANSCACTLRVKLADGTQQYFYAKALTAERFHESWNHPSRQKLIKAGDPFAPLAIFNAYIMLLNPAHDRQIKHLKWLINEDKRKKLLKACSIPQINDESFTIDILRYKPERRLVAKISKNQKPIAIIRTATPKEFTKMLVGNAFGMAHGGVSLLGADGTHCSLATKWQEGHSLCPEDGTLPSVELTKKLAKKLIRVHSATYEHPIRYSLQDEEKALRGISNSFHHIMPEHTVWLNNLTERVLQGMKSVPEYPSLIHGDFSLDQVVQRKNKAGEIKLHILDWDRSAYGSFLFDLATFQARLELQVIEGVLPHWQAEEIINVFLATYQKKGKANLTGLYWFIAAAMLRLAIEPFRKHSRQWEQYTLQLLQRVEEILTQGDMLYARAKQKKPDLDQDPKLEKLLDTTQMLPLLKEHNILTEYEQLKDAVLRRYKPTRRALVDYCISIPQADKNESKYIIGKYRAKGLDQKAYRLQKHLWQEFSDNSSTVCVSEALGKIPELNTWFQHRINGKCIGELLTVENGRLAFLGDAIAKALTELHSKPIVPALELPVWTPEKEMEVLYDRLTKFIENHPHFKLRIDKVLVACQQLIEQLNNTHLVTVHRDFYQDQILEIYGKPGYMAIIDLDLVCQGHAALDAGNYLAHIQEFALRQYGRIDALIAHEKAFKNQFLTYSSNYVTEKEIDIYTTLSLVRHIYISTLFEDRVHITECLLNICENKLLLTQENSGDL